MTLDEIAKAAVKFERDTGYPARVIIAQWAVESAWGKKPSGKNNFFGMTKARRHSGFSWVPTHEELTEAGIRSLSKEERATITSRIPIVNRPGFFRVSLKRKFADYASPLDSIADKVNLIMAPRSIYESAWKKYQASKNVTQFINDLAALGYATAGGYAQLVNRVAMQANVTNAIEKALRELPNQ